MNVTILSLSLNHLFQNSIKGFVNVGWSLLRTLVGTTGDTGFSDVFLGSPPSVSASGSHNVHHLPDSNASAVQ